MSVYLDILAISDEIQDIACRDQIEISVKRNAALLRDHIEKMDKKIKRLFAEMRATIAAQKEIRRTQDVEAKV